jgi:hypothetical protein
MPAIHKDAGPRQARTLGSSATVTTVAWRAATDFGLEEWIETGRRLGLLGRNVAWWIGDWLRYGNHTYGERYTRASRVTGYDVQTLMNMVYVASRFAPGRRRERLSWSHHAEVAALTPVDQDRWLDQAEQERLSVRCLRQEIRSQIRSASNGDASKQRALVGATDSPASHEDSVHGESTCPACGHALKDELSPHSS